MKLIFITKLLLVLAVVAADPFVEQSKWLREKGGFVSRKVRRSNGSFFATAPIKKNEEILMIPASALITGGPKEDMCETARTLLEEYKKKDKSEYAPYAQYVFESFPHNEHPLAWSDAAKNIFMSIVGEDLEPQEFGENSFEENCEYEENDNDKEALAAAYRIVVARGWMDKLVPVIDLLNHRNGKYHNIDQANSVHESSNISIIALRDISEGEQLYYSYNDCNDFDCEGISYTYVTPQIFADYGFVEQYPRRFNFPVYDEEIATFELDVDDNGVTKLDWIGDPASLHGTNLLRGNLKRLHLMNSTLQQGVNDLVSYERNLILEYYEAIVTALEAAVSWESPENQMEQQECAIDEDHDEEVCTGAKVYSDNLDDAPDPLQYQNIICEETNYNKKLGREIKTDAYESQYQRIEFNHYLDDETGRMNTCLFLQDWLQTCTSFRPHYHEWLIHYPASFLKEVKRVLFVGGGDNMILHEVLKYPSLELVIGMELDQQVVRGSFKNMGIQPHFDVDAVQWWFGDASKSLQMLPEDYYGTFDLVVVDLQTYVIESLLVTKELNVMDFAMLLLKPEGILTQNEDFVPRTNVDFARYTVDLELNDVPVLCQQSINMGSNIVDFSRAGRVDHDVDTVVFNSTAAGDFHAWWNYRHNAHRKSKVSAPANVDNDHETGERSRVVTTTRGDQGGSILVLEIEEVAEESSKRTLSQIKDLMVGVLETVGLKVLSSSSHESGSVFVLLQEGYVTLRSFGDISGYYACDLYFWNHFHRQDEAKAGLVSALGGQSSSSFRVVTSGMIHSPRSLRVPIVEDESIRIPIENLFFTGFRHLDVVLKEMSTLMHTSDPTVAVVCAQDITACSSLDILRQLQDSKSMNIVLVRSCISEESPQKETDCEKDVISALNVEGKIDGIIIDPLVSRKMGQVLREVLGRYSNRNKLLKKEYVIAAPFAASSGSWRRALMERFRTEMGKYRPSFHADISIFAKDTTEATNQGSFLSMFSTGDESFYSHLFEALNRIETSANIDISTRVNYVRDGVLNYIADFKASYIVTDSDYDDTAAREQWKSQHPVGLQSVIQFEIKRLQSPLAPGTLVLAKYEDNEVFTGRWAKGIVERVVDSGYDIAFEDGDIIEGMKRDLIRKWEEDREISVSDRVLANYDDDNDNWFQGTVLEKMSDTEYKVHIHNGRAPIEVMLKDDLIRQYEEVRDNDDAVASVSSTLLRDAVHDAFLEVSSDEQAENVKIEVYDDIEDGVIVSAFWDGGNAIVNWDGGHRFSLNLATYGDDELSHDMFREALTESFDFDFSLTSNDCYPRGFGRVVNFEDQKD